jgi:ankyrin repeat protein
LLIDRDADTSKHDYIHWAAQANQIELLRLLIQGGTPIDQETNQGKTSLKFACKEGHVQSVTWLLEHGAFIDHEDDGASFDSTPLKDAIRNDHYEVVKLLLDKGCDVDCGGIMYTAMQEACGLFSKARRNIQMAKLLASYGAELQPQHL